ncbi:glycoside hydrolase family 16 protein [Mycena filopes]|nr:glycoside hydrolase family 16 protein [Mycena filopes]
MPAFSCLVLLALLPLVARAPDQPDIRRHQNVSVEPRTTYTLKDHYTGTDFLDWDFFTTNDPTHGKVNYLTKFEAVSKGLAYVQADGTTILATDSKTQLKAGDNRDSIRIGSPKSYNSGLFIADIWAMPHGPTVWPAYWTVGPDWPRNGEIDIIEGVNDSPTNQMTLHTSAGCALATSAASKFTGKHTSQTSCASSGGNNNGCSIMDASPHVYGHQFNLVAGGVYAHIVGDVGISIWHFARDAIPVDITAQKPNPDGWGKPAAFFSSSTCNIAEHFKDHVLTFDTTLCGDWAGSDFPGGPSACAAAVADPSNFVVAKWELNYVSVYE